VDPDTFKGYDAEQRLKVQQRKLALQSVAVVQIESEEDARKERERYVAMHKEYAAVDSEIQQVQREFEELGQRLQEENSAGKRDVAGQIRVQFEDQKELLVRRHGQFMKLHAQLRSIRDQLVKWSAAKT